MVARPVIDIGMVDVGSSDVVLAELVGQRRAGSLDGETPLVSISIVSAAPWSGM